jgi:hypothetical protein
METILSIRETDLSRPSVQAAGCRRLCLLGEAIPAGSDFCRLPAATPANRLKRCGFGGAVFKAGRPHAARELMTV